MLFKSCGEAGLDESLIGDTYLVGHVLWDGEALFGVDLDALGVADEHVDDAVDVVDHCDVAIKG